jgi:oxalate decarboxylase/phosphoglucose isomerase-like protein (cupin superfamily)
VGDEALDMGPGDVCFIPRNTPHRIIGVSDEDLVILWAFGGAASIEQAGYVPLPD